MSLLPENIRLRNRQYASNLLFIFNNINTLKDLPVKQIVKTPIHIRERNNKYATVLQHLMSLPIYNPEGIRKVCVNEGVVCYTCYSDGFPCKGCKLLTHQDIKYVPYSNLLI